MKTIENFGKYNAIEKELSLTLFIFCSRSLLFFSGEKKQKKLHQDHHFNMNTRRKAGEHAKQMFANTHLIN